MNAKHDVDTDETPEALARWATAVVENATRDEVESLLAGYRARARGRFPKWLREHEANRAQALQSALEQSPK